MERYCEPPTAAKRTKWGEELCGRFPELSRFSIGQSVRGRPMDGFLLGSGAHTVLFLGGTHAQEWMTTILLYRFIEDACTHIRSGKAACRVAIGKAMHGRSLLFVPCLNPDGVETALCGDKTWQANARGVDLNHNFNAGWEKLQALERKNGIFSPGPRQFGGTAPESEPETAAITALCRRVQPAHAVSLHTQGEVIYWRYGHRTPERARQMATVLSAASGYELSEPEGLAVGGGFKDWFIEELGRPAFTVECGKGKNPLLLSDFSAIYERIREMLFLAAIM